MKRKRHEVAKGVTLEERRAAAVAVRQAAERDARLILERGHEAAEKIEAQADGQELDERIAARRAEIRAAAASASRAALEARAAGDEAAAEADRHAARRGELHARIVEQELVRRQRLHEIERATADGDLDQALRLEELSDSGDLESLRAEVARATAAGQDASDRAAQFAATAAQHSDEAAELRASLDAADDELRAEYETRRQARTRLSSQELWIFDVRHLAAAVATEAGAEQLRRDAERAKPINSADLIADPITIRLDGDGRYRGVTLPLNGAG